MRKDFNSELFFSETIRSNKKIDNCDKNCLKWSKKEFLKFAQK